MTKDDKGKKSASPDDIMSVSELRPLLKLAKGGQAISCAICLSGDSEGIILLDRQAKPKKLRAMLLKQADEIDLNLDAKSLRFGRASVDEGDEGVLRLVVHKAPSGAALHAAIKKRVKAAGFVDVLITADAGIENESEGEAPQAAAPSTPPDEPVAPQPMPAATPKEAAPSTVNSPSAAEPESVLAPQGAAQRAKPAGADLQAVTRMVAGLMRMIPEIAVTTPMGKSELIELARAANTAIKTAARIGDSAPAVAAAEALERAMKAAVAPDVAPANGAGLASTNGAAERSAATLSKSGLAWSATRKAVEKQIEMLHGKMIEAYKDHGFGTDLEKFFRAKIEPLLEQLDESLVHTLADVGNATQPEQQKALVEQAQKIVARYESYLANEPLIKKLDENPFVDLRIEETLSKTLITLNKTLVSVAGNIGL